MNPFDLDTTALVVWGLVVHLVADFLLQNGWMANNKAERRHRQDAGATAEIAMRARERDPDASFSVETWTTRWWDRHPAAYVHAGIHGALLALVFGWVAAPLALAHLIIDTRAPVVWWSQLIRQTQPSGRSAVTWEMPRPLAVADVGLLVRFASDQVFHIACIAVAALVIS